MNIYFTLKPKSDFITKKTSRFGGKPVKHFGYDYPEKSIFIQRDQLFSYQIDPYLLKLFITENQFYDLQKRVEKWFMDRPRHKAVVIIYNNKK